MASFAVITSRGPKWDGSRGIGEQDQWDAHAEFFDRLTAEGMVVLGGPISGGDPDEVALLAVQAADEAEVRAIFAQDPWASAGILKIAQVRPWKWWLDSRRT